MQNKFYLKKKSLSSILQLEKDAEKNSNFHNFRKFRAVRENRTYAMLKSVFSSIHTRNLKKKFGAVFEKMLKIPGGLHIKYPQILKNLFQNLKALTRIRSTGEYPFWKKSYVWFRRQQCSQTDRRTFSFQLGFRYQGPRKQGFWLHHVLGDFFS